jgi:sporulation protein YlmC with PRC-barrel domain
VIRLSQLTGQRVLTRDGARQLGSIRRLLLDPARGTVVSAELEGGVGDATMLDWASVASIGPDAVMVETEDAVRGAQSEIEQRLSAGELDLRGKQVLDEGGDSLGPLDDLEFDGASGRLARLHVPGHALPMERLIAVGPDAIIVPRPR